MCGLMGYAGPSPAAPILLEGLARLEYRGYDSAGLAVLEGKRLRVEKLAGRVSELAARVRGLPWLGRLGIAHTRWATHGAVTESNAHPHLDCGEQIAVITNGIVENWRELRAELEAGGHRFRSETDTEVIAHLAEALAPSLGVAGAVREAAARLRGAYAFLLVHAASPDRLFVARRSAPLVIGVAEGAAIAASDIPALLPHTREVVYLGDGESAELWPGGIRLTDAAGKPVTRAPVHVPWSAAEAEKGGYAHFMLKEIHEQPRAVGDTLVGRLDLAAGRPRLEELPLSDPRYSGARRILLVACGTAWHAGLFGAYLLEELARVPATAVLASELRYGNPVLGPETAVVAVSQSGETADTLAAVRLAREAGSPVIAVCNVMGSQLTRDSDATLYTRAGLEVGVASTKAYTTQLAALALLAVEWGVRRATLPAAEVAAAVEALAAAPGGLAEALRLDGQAADLARQYRFAYNFLYLGRRHNWPTAAEGALKLKEISYIHAEAYPGGEMKHGPIAMIEPTFPTVAIALEGSVREKMLSNVSEIRARKGPVILLATRGDRDAAAAADHVLELPRAPERFSPLSAVVPLQLFAYHVAIARACDPDRPRNLAKSVTVE